MLNDCAAAIDPVAAIDIQHTAYLLDGGAMDVPANHAIESAFAYRMDDGIFEIEDESDG